MITDAAGTIVFVNPAFTRLTGYKLTEAVGTKAYKWTDPGGATDHRGLLPDFHPSRT
jgi:PAS domain S-box-containing protein